MKRKKPYILPYKKPTCFITPEIFNEIEDEIQQNERDKALELLNKYSKNAVRETTDE